MDTRTDRRVRRTRQALISALLALMANKSYEDITVQEIIDRADVGRSTFYTHFPVKDALLEATLAQLRAITEAAKPGLGFGLPLLLHIAEHRDLAAALFGPATRGRVVRQIESAVAGAIAGEVSARKAGGPLPPEAYTRFVTAAYLALVQWWLEAGQPLPAAEFDNAVRRLVGAALR